MKHDTATVGVKNTILKEKAKYLEEAKSSTPMQSTVVKSDGLIPEEEMFLIHGCTIRHSKSTWL